VHRLIELSANLTIKHNSAPEAGKHMKHVAGRRFLYGHDFLLHSNGQEHQKEMFAIGQDIRISKTRCLWIL
jgi:hypothetical protein